MALAQLVLVLAQARAREEHPPLTVVKVQALFHYLDCAKRKFERLAVGMMNGVNAFSTLNPAFALMVICGIVIYAFSLTARFMMWIVMAFFHLAARNHVFKALIHLTEGLNNRLLPSFPGLNGLGLLVGFSILLGCVHVTINVISVNPRRSRNNPKHIGAILSRRSKMIGALPKTKYGCLRRRSDDANRNDSCAICLGCIGEEDGVRILPNCRHYFHISCIDCWLLPCTINNSSCPLCRTTVIGHHSS